MSDYKTQLKTLVILIILTLFSSFYVVLNFEYIFSNVLVGFSLFCSVVSFVFFYIIFRRFVMEFRYDLDEKKQRERNIHDCYMYHMLLNPPEENN